ncbi:MAG: hypothetical protein AB7T01_02205 [Acidithiobacillus sp.]
MKEKNVEIRAAGRNFLIVKNDRLIGGIVRRNGAWELVIPDGGSHPFANLEAAQSEARKL